MTHFQSVLNYLRSQSSPKKRGDAFELYCKWYLENDHVYSKSVKHVWLWKDWPNNWGPDHGIDLVAETYDGRFWAIQAKAYSDKYSISKHDVDRFLSESSRSIFSYRLIISTTNSLDYSGERVLEGQEKPVGIVCLRHLLATNLVWPNSIDDLRPLLQTRQQPRPHQQEAVASVLEGFQTQDRGQLIMACGTGKTGVGLWVAEGIGATKTLVIVPSLSLLSQTLQRWAANSAQPFRFLPVCSDESVADEDAIADHIYELGVPATTDPEAIRQFLAQDGSLIVFSTYQSSPEIAKACALSQIEFDLVIADEAHRCAGNISKRFATVLKPDAILAKKRLFMSATPKIFGDNLRQAFQSSGGILASMDNQEEFGPVFHRLPLSAAIERGLLSDYRIGIIAVKAPDYARLIEDRAIVTVDGEHSTDAKSLACIVAVALAMRRYQLSRLLSFHSTVRGAKSFSREFQALLEWLPTECKPEGPVLTDYVVGTMSASERDKRISMLRDLLDHSHAIISNARCLSEGIDLPTLDGVVFANCKKSHIDIVQAIGRAIRKSEDKSVGTIIVPVLLKDGESHDSALNSSEFSHVWDILKALRSHDEALGMEIDNLRQEWGRKGFLGTVNLSKVFIDLPITVGKDFARSIELKIVEEVSAGWEFFFGLLERYAAIEGHTQVPAESRIDGHKLGSWVSVQRKIFKRGMLSSDRMRRLEALSGWAWDRLESSWQMSFHTLRKYFDRTGTSTIPQGLVEDGINIFNWATVQRKTFKNGKMTQARQTQLESLPLWYWDYSESRSLRSREALQEFIRREGHSRVPTTHLEDGFRLGQWVREAREAYLMGDLPKGEASFLGSLGNWSWGDSSDQAWNYGFSLLERFVEAHGHAQPKSGYKTGDFALATWAKAQRKAYLEGALSDSKIERLEQLPDWSWQVFDDRNKLGFRALDSFVKREGHSRVPSDHVEDGFKLGRWVAVKRLAAGNPNSKHRITEQQRRQLEAYPGWVWSGNQGRWETGKQYLLQFLSREGHCRVKMAHIEDGFELGRWIGIWRYQHNKGTLSQERADFFSSLPGWSWDVKGDRWHEGLEQLQKYANRVGSADVPATHREGNFTLGTWVSTQRYAYAQGKVPRERLCLLESVPGWTWSKVGEDWDRGLQYLRRFVSLNGHADVPAAFQVEDFSLGVWIQGQKYSHNCGRLGEARVQILEGLPSWSWDLRQDRWEKGYEILLTFYRRMGTARVPFGHIEEGFKLGGWVHTQRKSYTAGKIPDERIAKLASLKGWCWNTRKG